MTELVEPMLYIDHQRERRLDFCPRCGGERYWPSFTCPRCERRQT